MFLIATRLITLLAIAYLFGLFVAWLFSLFNDSNGGDEGGGDNPDTPKPPEPGKTLEQKRNKKRLVEVDEYYYLEEFDLSKKQEGFNHETETCRKRCHPLLRADRLLSL